MKLFAIYRRRKNENETLIALFVNHDEALEFAMYFIDGDYTDFKIREQEIEFK